MENFYRYRIEPFHWLFTNRLKSAATIRYDLTYSADRRSFEATVTMRSDHFGGWAKPTIVEELTIDRLRSLLPPADLARCTAASIATTPRRNPDA